VVALRDEPVFISSVGEADRDTVRTSVCVRTLDCLGLSVRASSCILQVTLLLSADSIPSLVTASQVQQVYGYRFHILEDWKGPLKIFHPYANASENKLITFRHDFRQGVFCRVGNSSDVLSKLSIHGT
jgi:hypothetical protein